MSASSTASTPVRERRFERFPHYTRIANMLAVVRAPMELYWRKVQFQVKTKTGEIVNKEGLIMPSFSLVTWVPIYRVEELENGKYKVDALAYSFCPLCGRVITNEVTEVEFEPRTSPRKFTHSVAYEIALAVSTPGLAAKMKAHLAKRHNMRFQKVGRRKVVVVRKVGLFEELTYETWENAFTCERDKQEVIGVYGIMYHVATSHFYNKTAFKLVDTMLSLTRSVARDVLGLRTRDIPITDAFRSVFRYKLSDSTSKKVLILGKWRMKLFSFVVVKSKQGTWLLMKTPMERPVRTLYHHPALRPIPHVLAYKTDPRAYMKIMKAVAETVEKQGDDPEPIRTFARIVADRLAYSSIEKKHMFYVDPKVIVEYLNELKNIAEEIRWGMGYG